MVKKGKSNSWDPLAEKDILSHDLASAALKRQIQNILSSYHGWFDPFSEMIQNALDAVDARAKLQENGYTPTIWIKIDLKENQISVTDNGIGFKEKEFKTFLAPEISFKSSKSKDTRGNKGVGATYLAYGFNFLQIGTKTNEYSYLGVIRDAREWLEDTENMKTRPVIIEEKKTLHEIFSTIDRGSTFSLKLIGGFIRPKDLNYTNATTATQWEAILKIKTPLGGIYLSEEQFKKKCFIEVIDGNGNKSDIELENLDYLYPDKIISTCKNLKDIDEKIEELRLGGRYDGDLPKSYYMQNGLFQVWTADDILNNKWGLKIKLDDFEKRVITEENVVMYAFQGYSTKLWNNYNDNILKLRKGLKIIWGGLQIATKMMPQGEPYIIKLTKRTGLTSTTHVVVHFDKIKSDLGRKGFAPEIVKLCQKLAVGSVKILRQNEKFMKDESADPLSTAVERQIHDWIKIQEEHEKEHPLIIKRNDLFLPLREISITSAPLNEQDVIALFNQLLAGGVIRGIKIMSTHQSNTYDGVFRYFIKKPFSNHTYDKDKNPLGIDEINCSEETESIPFVLEYKLNFDDLISEFEKGSKNPKNIKLVIVWEMGSKWANDFEIISLLHYENLQHRSFHGLTHLTTYDSTNHPAFDMICLKEMIDYINDPDSVQEYQYKTYMEF